MKVMITGGEGFVGKHLISHLTSSGHKVISLDRVATERSIACDITKLDEMTACVNKHKPDAFIHLAGIAVTNVADDAVGRLAEANILGTLNACLAASQLDSVTFLFILGFHENEHHGN